MEKANRLVVAHAARQATPRASGRSSFAGLGAALLGAALAASGCSENPPPANAPSSAQVPTFERAPLSKAAPAEGTPADTPAVAEPPAPPGNVGLDEADDAPEPTAAAEPDEGGDADAEEPGEPSAPEPVGDLPAVTVKNVGMHIGGGPNDTKTKQPIREAMTPHFDALKSCFRLVDDPKKGGTFGVEILIGREGGRAKITDARSGLKGQGVKECLLKVFEEVEFKRPPRGAPQKISYSLRFTPDRQKPKK